MLSEKTKRILHWTGSGLSVLGIAFVVVKFIEYAGEIDRSIVSTSAVALAGLAVVYGAANLFLAFAWRDLLEHLGVVVKPQWAIRTFGVSQLAKYAPGNFFHFVGRQALGIEAGLPGRVLAKSALWELGLISVVSCTFVIMILPNFFSRFNNATVLIFFSLTVLAGAWVLYSVFSRSIARAAGYYVAFLVISGIVFLLVLSV